MTIDLKIF